MRSGVRKRSVLLAFAAAAAVACGEDPKTTTNPAAPSLFVAETVQVTGQWRGSGTLSANSITGVTGSNSECAGEDLSARLQANIVSEPFSLTMTQDEDKVTGQIATASGVTCSYTGKTGQNLITLTSVSCKAPTIVMRCSNGSVREMDLVGSSVSGVIEVANPRTINGTLTNTYNLWTSTVPRFGVGSLVLNYSYTVNR